MMWRPLALCAFVALCLAGFRHAYRPPSLPGCTLLNARMACARLPGVDFRQVNLSGSDLAQADLSGAHLQAANLSQANLGGANLSSADLREANLRGANMMQANLANALIEGAVYDQHTTWPDHVTPERGGARFEESPKQRVPQRRHGLSALVTF
jgi:uncharacterized protein YjbI with pentapeptide repeats